MNAETFSYSLNIKESYLDTFGHVNNAIYPSLFEEARWEFITKNGYGINKIKETALGPTVLKMTLTFRRELRLRENIVIESQVTSYEKKIGKLSQKIIRNGEVCCDAEFTIALFDLVSRKLVSPTEDWLYAVGVRLSTYP